MLNKCFTRFLSSRVINTFRRYYTQQAINIRRATIEDYEGVICIRNTKELFDGYDYLSDRYKMFIQDSLNTGYVGTSEDRVNAFVLCIPVDDGTTGILYGHRLHTNIEGKRVSRDLVTYMFKDQLKRGSLKRFGICIDESTVEKHLHGGLIKRGSFIAKRMILPYKSTKTKLTHHLQENSKEITYKRTDAGDFCNLLSSSTLCQRLFPHERIFKLWMPFRPMVKNFPRMIDDRTTFHGSGLKRDANALFSIGTYSFTSNGLLYHMDIFGTARQRLEDHLHVHLQFCVQHVESDITFEIAYDEDMELGLADEIMNFYGLERINNYGNHAMYCYETTARNVNLWLDGFQY